MDDETRCISCGGMDPRCSAFHPEYGFSCILPPHSGPHYDTAGGHWTPAGQLGNPAEIPSNAVVELDLVVRSVRFDLDTAKPAQALATELQCLHIQQPIWPGRVPLVCTRPAGHGGAHRSQQDTTWEPQIVEHEPRTRGGYVGDPTCHRHPWLITASRACHDHDGLGYHCHDVQPDGGPGIATWANR